MRLINTSTLQLEEFADETNLKYVILSHRWEDGEVSFSDMQSLDVAKAKKGFYKISKCCEVALRRNCRYAWIDTCCIDKTSSAELSEAINSMFRWYANSEVCFVYLSDVGTDGQEIVNQFKSSKWFERGWTLQELIAPSQVFFYNSAWLRFGSKHRLVNHLVEASGVSAAVLLGEQSVFEISIAQRMCWASRRKTTRPEDRAYSLMGIFNVNMAMLYGEGDKAFLRLQEEIIKHSDDASIFAWTGVPANGSGLLAPSLDCFAQSSDIKIAKSTSHEHEEQPWTMTNKGLSVELRLTPWSSETYLAILDCNKPAKATPDSLVGIFLRRLQGHQYRRVSAETGDLLKNADYSLYHRNVRRIRAFIKQDELSAQSLGRRHVPSLPLYGVKLLPIGGVDMKAAVLTTARWDADSGIAELSPGHLGPVLTIDLILYPRSLERVQIALNFDFRPRVTMGRRLNNKDEKSLHRARAAWNFRFARTAHRSADCFIENQDLWLGRSYGAIRNAVGEDIFLYEIPANQQSSLIHIMHQPPNGGAHVLLGELDIHLAAFRGSKVWEIGLEMYSEDGASPEFSESIMRSYERGRQSTPDTDIVH